MLLVEHLISEEIKQSPQILSAQQLHIDDKWLCIRPWQRLDKQRVWRSS